MNEAADVHTETGVAVSPASASGGQGHSSEKTKELLIEAAIKLFAAKGYDGTTVKDISDAAGVNISLVSYHFQGKEGLYRTCLEQFGKDRLKMAERLLQPPSSREELRIRLDMFIDEVLGSHIDQPELSQIIHRECDLDLPLALDVFQSTFMKIYDCLLGFIKEAKAKNLIRKDIDLEVATGVMFGSIVSFSRMDRLRERMRSHSIKDPKFREKVRNHIVQIFLEGALAPEDSNA